MYRGIKYDVGSILDSAMESYTKTKYSRTNLKEVSPLGEVGVIDVSCCLSHEEM